MKPVYIYCAGILDDFVTYLLVEGQNTFVVQDTETASGKYKVRAMLRGQDIVFRKSSFDFDNADLHSSLWVINLGSEASNRVEDAVAVFKEKVDSIKKIEFYL